MLPCSRTEFLFLLMVLHSTSELTNCYTEEYVSLSTSNGLLKNFTFPSDLKTYCPLTSFCTDDDFSYNVTPGHEPCCRPCSCRPDCMLTHNCCRDDFASSDLIDYTSCVFPGVTKYKFFIEYVTNYRMVDRCPDHTALCRDQLVAPWGTVYPVTDLETKTTYINTNCARCHNVTDVFPWELHYICPLSSDQHNAGTFSFDDFLKGSRDCSIEFIPPAITYFYPEQCMNRVKRDCRQEMNTQFQDLCNAFNASFTHHLMGFSSGVYANVYCFLCSIKTLTLQYSHECHILSKTLTSKGFLENAMINVIDYDVQNLLNNFDNVSKDTKKRDTHEVCGLTLNRTKGTCRPLLCPEGQLRTTTTECKYFSSQWTNINISLLVNLTSESEDKKVSVECLTKELKFGNAIKLDIPGQTQFSYSLFFHPSPGFKNASYFIAKLVRKEPKNFVPASQIGRIKAALQAKWKLTACGETFVFKSEINKYFTFQSYGHHKLNDSKDLNIYCSIPILNFIPMWVTTGNESFQPCEKHVPLRLLPIKDPLKTINHEEDGLWLTKTFFCNQIELQSGEFMYYRDRINLMDSKKFLGDAEYRRIPGADGLDTIRTCVEEMPALKSMSPLMKASLFSVICGFGFNYYFKTMYHNCIDQHKNILQ